MKSREIPGNSGKSRPSGIVKPLTGIFRPFRGVFSPRIEDSLRLRAIGVVFVWLAALGLLWAGGSPWFTLGGAGLATLGHGVSWWRRRRPSRVVALGIAGLIIILSFLMRGQMLEALSGNWVPLGQFLVLVQAISSFDMRTRGGLYTGIVFSGIVLFFASQQAFDAGFIIFIIGFMVLLLAFLAVGFLEDGVRSARVYWRRGQASVLIFWISAACAVFLLASLAFWVMPRGQTSLGLPDVAILPFSSNSLDPSAIVPSVDPASIPLEPDLGQALPEEFTQAPAASSSGDFSGLAGNAQNLNRMLSPPSPSGGYQGNLYAPDENGDVVFFVRSKVASYWRGSTMDAYDGRYWRESSQTHNLTLSSGRSRLWYNRESFGLNNRLRYGQTFFIQKDQPRAVFSGYRGLRVIADEDSLVETGEGTGVRAGDSYRVLSVHPLHTPVGLRESRAEHASPRYLVLPPDSARLRELVRRITEGAENDFAEVEGILVYLDRQQTFDPQEPGRLTSATTLEEFLFEDHPGTAMDYATATVMLARASGLPSRLALGYLPGIRDPLSGAYMVRESDAHAWAEVYFADQGWVPVDSAPRPDITLLFNTDAGVGYLFGSGFSEEAYQAVKATPSKIAGLLSQGLDSQALVATLSLGSLIIFLALGWRRFRWLGPNRPDRLGWCLPYAPLPGPGRREFLRLYAAAEKLLQRSGNGRRLAGQTVGDYSAVAAAIAPEAKSHLDWFANGAWQAAYDPKPFPSQLVAEGQPKLRGLKAALRAGRG